MYWQSRIVVWRGKRHVGRVSDLALGVGEDQRQSQLADSGTDVEERAVRRTRIRIGQAAERNGIEARRRQRLVAEVTRHEPARAHTQAGEQCHEQQRHGRSEAAQPLATSAG